MQVLPIENIYAFLCLHYFLVLIFFLQHEFCQRLNQIYSRLIYCETLVNWPYFIANKMIKCVTTEGKNEIHNSKIIIANTYEYLLCASYHSKCFAWKNLFIYLNYPMMYILFQVYDLLPTIWKQIFLKTLCVFFSHKQKSDQNWNERIYILKLSFSLNN